MALTDTEYVKSQNQYDGEKNISIQTNPSQYVITEDQKQNKLHYTKYQNINEEKEIADQTDFTQTDTECIKRQTKYEVKKNNTAQTKYNNISKEQIDSESSVESQSYNEDEIKIAFETDFVQIDIERIKSETKYEVKKNYSAQTKYIPHSNIYKEQIQSKPSFENQSYNEDEIEIAIQTDLTQIDLKRQTNFEGETNNAAQIKNTPYKDIFKEQIKSKSYVKSQSEDEIEIGVQTDPAPNNSKCMKKRTKHEVKNINSAQTKYMPYKNISKEQTASKSCDKRRNYNVEEKKIALQKSISAPIKLEYVKCINYNEDEKNIGVQTNLAQNITITKGKNQTEPENIEYQTNNEANQKMALTDSYAKNQNQYNRVENIGIQTNPSQYVITESQNTNEEEKEIAGQKDPATTGIACLKAQKKYEKEKNYAAQTKYRNFFEEKIESESSVGSYNKDEIETAVQTDFAKTDTECMKKQTKNQMKKNCAAQTKYIPYNNIFNEQTQSKPFAESQSYNEDEIENKIQTDLKWIKKQTKYETNNAAQKKDIPYKNFFKEQIESNSYVENQSEDEIVIGFQTRTAPNNSECLKKHTKYEVEKIHAAQTNYIPYKNISKEQNESKSYVKSQKYNEEKEIVQKDTTLTDPKCMTMQNKCEGEENIGVQSKYMKYRSIFMERVDQTNNKREKEIAFQPRLAVTGPDCMKKQNKYEEEKITIEIYPAPPDLECLKRQIQYERETATAIQNRNVSKEQIKSKPYFINENNDGKKEIAAQIKCVQGQKQTEAGCVKYPNNYQREKQIVKTNTESIISQYMNIRNSNEREQNIALPTKHLQYRNISSPLQKKQIQTEPEHVINEIKYKYYANQDNKKSRNEFEKQTSKKYEAFIEKNINPEYFKNKSDEQEKNITIQTKYVRYKTSREEIQNEAKYEMSLQQFYKTIGEKRKTLGFKNIHNEQKQIYETSKTISPNCNCNQKCSNYVTSKDFSNPKNFKHLFAHKNIENNSQYIKNEEKFSSTLQDRSIKCSKNMISVDKPERFTHFITKFCNLEYSKLIKSSDDYFRKVLVSQNTKHIDYIDSLNSKVTGKEKKLNQVHTYLNGHFFWKTP